MSSYRLNASTAMMCIAALSDVSFNIIEGYIFTQLIFGSLAVSAFLPLGIAAVGGAALSIGAEWLKNSVKDSYSFWLNAYALFSKMPQALMGLAVFNKKDGEDQNKMVNTPTIFTWAIIIALLNILAKATYDLAAIPKGITLSDSEKDLAGKDFNAVYESKMRERFNTNYSPNQLKKLLWSATTWGFLKMIAIIGLLTKDGEIGNPLKVAETENQVSLSSQILSGVIVAATIRLAFENMLAPYYLIQERLKKNSETPLLNDPDLEKGVPILPAKVSPLIAAGRFTPPRRNSTEREEPLLIGSVELPKPLP